MSHDNSFFDWRSKSLCGTLTPSEIDNLFFPNNGRSINRARKFCGACPVNKMCLDDALKHPELKGIVAGFSEKERRAIYKLNHPQQVVKKRSRGKSRHGFRVT